MSTHRTQIAPARLRLICAGLATTGLVAAGAIAAHATGGSNDELGEGYYPSNSWSETADTRFTFGDATSSVFVGDWDGDGADSFGVRRGNEYHLRDTLSAGPADTTVAYGRADDTVLVGDWDGDGHDTLAVRRGAEYFLHNTLESGPADEHAIYGRADDTVLVGDWDGDGADTLGVRRGISIYLHDEIATGPAETVLDYGRLDDGLVVGDWDGDGVDSPMVRRADFIRAAVRGATLAAAEGDAAELEAYTDAAGYDELWYAFQGFYDPPLTPSSIENCHQSFDTGVITCDVYSDDHERPIGRAEVAPTDVGTFEVVGYEIYADWEGSAP
ncbi:hypothetical protein [Georgenia sp. Z1491]|uniref:hypothetical protein n=1 Tax=Georgenia sp. Z1491 TaxID=3416707 RepID=UPI003CF76187